MKLHGVISRTGITTIALERVRVVFQTAHLVYVWFDGLEPYVITFASPTKAKEAEMALLEAWQNA